MDGNFVPNITLGPGTIKALRPLTRLPFDVHLMIENPDRYLKEFVDAGSDLIIPHIEASPDIFATVRSIHSLGKRAGVAISPDTSTSTLRDVASSVELILVMSVYPGFGGQKFLNKSVARLAEVREILNEVGSNAAIAIDGGVTPDTVTQAVRSGASNLIAGTAVFHGASSVRENISALRQAAMQSD